MLPYPNIDPIALSLGPIKIHWYGLMYLFGFGIGYLLLKKLLKEKNLPHDETFRSDLLLMTLIGVIFGGRLGYIIFYSLPFYISNPLDVFKVWNGGMSFHGGLLGVILALLLFARKKHVSFFALTDAILPTIPPGIFLVRMGNFINGELYGRITNSLICMRFPTDPANCRYPSQLIEAIFEGLIIGIIILIARKKIKKTGSASWLFVLIYGIVRFCIEFIREPDAQIGLLFGGISLGQYLSAAMIIAGMIGYKFNMTRAK